MSNESNKEEASVAELSTLRKQAEMSLLKSEQLRDAILESVRDFIFIKDNNRNYVLVNDFFKNRFDIDPIEFIGKKDDEISIFENRKDTGRVVDDTDKQVLQGKIVEYELTHLIRGEWITFDIIKTPIFDSNGNIASICGLSRDVTERKRSMQELKNKNEELHAAYEQLASYGKEIEEKYKEIEESQKALRDSEERYRGIIENMLDVYYRTDKRGNLVIISPSGASLLGYDSANAMQGISVADSLYLVPEERGRFLAKMKEKSHVRDYEVMLKHRDGTPIPVSTSSRYYYDRKGDVLGIEGFFRDIRDRKHREEELLKSEELAISILKSVPHGLFGVEERTIFFANDAMEDVFGWKPEELVGKSTRILFRNEEEWKEYGSMLYSWLKNTPVVTFESSIPFVRKDGQEILCRNSISRTGKELGITNRIVATFEDITERKSAEEALKKSEERYRLLFEGAGEGILIVRGETIQFANPALVELLGYPESVITSRPFISFIHPDDREMVMDRHLRRMKGESVETGYAFRIIRADGTVKWLKISSRIILWEGSSASLSFVIDVTGLKQIEEALRKSEQLQADIIDFLPDATLAIDIDGRIIIWNRAIEEMTGITAKEMIGKGDHVYTIPFYGEARPQLMDLVLKDDEELATKYRMISREGEALVAEAFCPALYNNEGAWVFAKASPLRDQNGNFKGVIEIIRDITKQKRFEESLKDYQRNLTDIINFLPDATFVIDSNGVVTAWNHAIESLTGIKAEAMIGKGNYEYAVPFYGERRPIIIDLILSADDEFLNKVYDRVNHQDAILSGEVYVPMIGGDGKGAYLWGNASRLYDANGNVIGAIQSIRDITEHRQAEAERRELQERLQRAEKMESLGLLAGGVAHDLNNVLGIVVGYAEMIMDEVDESYPMRDDLQKILEAGNRSAAIVQDLLTLARRGVQTKTVVNINAVVEDCRMTPEFEKIFSYNPLVKLKTDLEPDLLNIMGSPVHLAKTMVNLAANAVEAMPNGGVLKISTANQYLEVPIQGYDHVREGDYVLLKVSDTGEGILERDIRRIFEPFYTKKIMGRSGTGLGLAVVWGTVKDHNGYINVESEEGKGTTFTLFFPVTREETIKEMLSASITEYMGKDEAILIVDDIKGQRELASRMLTKLNYRASAVASGEEAVEYLRTHRADLVILDMIMDPGMDGLDTYRKILETSPEQKAIIVSGFSESDRVREAQKLGAGAYVRKPYVLERLGMAIRKEIERK